MKLLLLLLTLAAHQFSLAGVRIGDNLETFQDKYINVFCGQETPTTQVCEQYDSFYSGRRAWMRAEFTNSKLTYLSFTSNAGSAVAQKISGSLHKEYGDPPTEIDRLPDALDDVWSIGSNCGITTDGRTECGQTEELELSFTSAAENGLGHPVIRVSLAEKEN